MGRKLDLTGLTDGEAAHVLQVVQRDMRLRKKEEERLSELKQELDEEGSRCLLLSKQTCFNRRCCIRCCSPFSFLLNPKRQCSSCRYNICKACRVYNKRDRVWLCSACQKSRLLKVLSLEWFYSNVKKRFKRFGSAKVLKTLYRKHLAEHIALSELTDGSACGDSVCNEGSVCGSDSAFYRQTEEHSMAEMLSVATRVAQEAIDEAISKAEADTSTQEKQSEVLYLHEHRAELVQELAETIVEKIISRRKTLAEMKAQCDQQWPFGSNMELQHQPSDQACSSLKHQPDLWRSLSAFSLLDEDLIQESPPALQKEGAGSPMAGWKGVERLDNAVLKSPDGNWLALQSAQMSRPGLLARRKSLVFSALEVESGVKSAYEGLDSDNETKPEPEPDSSWGAVLQEIHRKMTDSNLHLIGDQMSPPATHKDSEGNWKLGKPLQALLKKKVPAELRKPSSSRRTSIIDVNFNLTGAGEEDEEEKTETGESDEGKALQAQRGDKEAAACSPLGDVNQKGSRSDAVTSDLLTSGATSPEAPDRDDGASGGGGEPIQRGRGTGSPVSGGDEFDQMRDEEEERYGEEESDCTEDKDEEEMEGRLYRLVARSSLSYFSSTDEELDRDEQSDEDWSRSIDEDMEEEEKTTDEVTFRLCRLEKGVGAARFSSTEDELDRTGTEDEEEEEEEHLSMKVCRLVNQINAAQFSSTEDELDRAGVDEEETDEGALWTQPQRDHLRDLASLVSASQFSSTEDELDRAGRSEEVEELWGGAGFSGGMDVKMFDMRKEVHSRTEVEEDEKGGDEPKFDGREEASVETEENRGEREETGAAQSDEDNGEFNRIIGSMLTMTLEDMQVEDNRGGGGGVDEDQENGLKEEEANDFRATAEEAGEIRVELENKDKRGGEEEAQGAAPFLQNPAETETAPPPEEPDVWDGEKLEENRLTVGDPESSQAPGGAADCEDREEKPDKAKPPPPPEEIEETSSAAASLRSITTEVLKVLNATEELLQREEGGVRRDPAPSLPPNADPLKLDQQFCKLEESVYVVASAAYSLEAELGELEGCARGISSSTSVMELSFLEEQVAAAAAKVQHSELQICGISTRIAALKSAGLNVDPQSRLSKTRSACEPQAVTLDSSRQLRRRLPATPVQGGPHLSSTPS